MERATACRGRAKGTPRCLSVCGGTSLSSQEGAQAVNDSAEHTSHEETHFEGPEHENGNEKAGADDCELGWNQATHIESVKQETGQPPNGPSPKRVKRRVRMIAEMVVTVRLVI